MKMCGQSVAEFLVFIVVIGALWLSVSWLGRFQDLAIAISNTTRYGAFYIAHQDGATSLSNPSNSVLLHQKAQWSNSHSKSLLDSSFEAPNTRHYFDAKNIDDSMQIGKSEKHARVLRSELGTEESGFLVIQTELEPSRHELYYPAISRRIVIATGSGLSGSEDKTVFNIRSSSYAWSQAEKSSFGLAKLINKASEEIDSAWGRAKLNLDWLSPWKSHVPGHSKTN